MQLAREAYALARAGQQEQAIATLQKSIALAPANPLYRSALGGIYQSQGKLAEAADAFKQAVHLAPNNSALTAKLETILLDLGAELARAQRYRAGLSIARDAAQRYPNSTPVHLMLGLFETRNQQNLNAVAAYRKALQLDPQSAEAAAGLGIAQTAAGLTKEAQATFESSIRQFPNNATLRQAYGVLLIKLAEANQSPATRAVEMFNSALTLDPKSAEAHYQLGNLALSQGDPNQALTHLSAAAANGLDDARLHYALARTLRRLGKTAEADQHLQLFEQRKQAATQ